MMTFNQLVKNLPSGKNTYRLTKCFSKSNHSFFFWSCFGLRSLTSDTNVVYQESA